MEMITVAFIGEKMIGACLTADRDPHQLHKWKKSMEEQKARFQTFDSERHYLLWFKQRNIDLSML